MTKRIWKLYKEVRRLRSKVKTLEADRAEANIRCNAAECRNRELNDYIYNLKQSRVVAFAIPKETIHIRGDQPFISFREPIIPNEYKIKVFDELLEKRYIKRVVGETYIEYRIELAR
jgi:hypothetical protein